jgi:hypothetical protein
MVLNRGGGGAARQAAARAACGGSRRLRALLGRRQEAKGALPRDTCYTMLFIGVAASRVEVEP